ncbi:MAG: hypothetical protein KBT03_06125 [Bacteroidales bacterium]|nr:hypothetical protein [Candidatus Scybalousia scybalohippi]
MKKLSIIDIATLIASAVIIIIALAFLLHLKSNKLYLTKYVSPETGVVYYITDNAIIPLFNADGTLYTEEREDY